MRPIAYMDPDHLDAYDRSGEAEEASLEWLKEHVDELEPFQRRCIEAVYWEQVPVRALARELGVSRSAVQKALQQAIEHLHWVAVREMELDERIADHASLSGRD